MIMSAVDPLVQLGFIIGGAIFYVLWLFQPPLADPRLMTPLQKQ
jgi:hypothetical protein